MEHSIKFKLAKNDLIEMSKNIVFRRLNWYYTVIVGVYCVIPYIVTGEKKLEFALMALFLPICVIYIFIEKSYKNILNIIKYEYMFDEFEMFSESNILYLISKDKKININLNNVKIKKKLGFIWINDNGFNMMIPLEIKKYEEGKVLLEYLEDKEEIDDKEFQSYL